jgi:hypothetical protein
VNYELKRMWKEVCVPHFKVISQHMYEGTEETLKEELIQDSQSPDLD